MNCIDLYRTVRSADAANSNRVQQTHKDRITEYVKRDALQVQIYHIHIRILQNISIHLIHTDENLLI